MPLRTRLATLGVRPTLVGAAALPLLLVSGLSAAPARAHEPAYQLLLDFDSGESLDAYSSVTDTSGSGNHGSVRTDFGGQLELGGSSTQRHARFPGPCQELLCPTALVKVPDAPGLDPGRASFRWGVHLRLRPDETSQGQNLMQKGLWGDPGGQWKLQVDGREGKPSCVVSGYRDGLYRRAEARSSVTVATGAWTSVSCVRTQSDVRVVVDGQVRGVTPMQPVLLDSTAPITIGAKFYRSQDNDQFHGRLDHARMRLL